MNKNAIFVLMCTMIPTSALAGPPGENTSGSTITEITADVAGLKECIITGLVIDSAGLGGTSADALSQFLSNVQVSFAGDVALRMTRHGNSGAVHQIELTGNMVAGTLFLQVAKSSTAAGASAEASATAEVEAAAGAIAQALAGAFVGINEEIDLGITKITVKAGAEAAGEGAAVAGAASTADASSSSNAGTAGAADTEASAKGEGTAATGSVFYVQGANIEEFSTQLNLATGALVSVQTDALAQTYADAFATAAAYAMAQASVAAAARGELAFKFDLPIIGSGSLPIVDDFDSAADAANTILAAADEIAAQAGSLAESSAKTLAQSTVGVDLVAGFENLPGTEDFLEVTSIGDVELDCSSSVSTVAQAD